MTSSEKESVSGCRGIRKAIGSPPPPRRTGAPPPCAVRDRAKESTGARYTASPRNSSLRWVLGAKGNHKVTG